MEKGGHMGKRPQGDLELYKYIGHQIKLARLDNILSFMFLSPIEITFSIEKFEL